MFDVKVDTTKLNLAIAQFAKESRKELGVVIEKQAGILVGHLIALTPPAAAKGQAMSDRGGINISAKKRGEGTIKADIAALFPTTKKKPEQVRGMIENGYVWGTGRGGKKIPRYAESIAELESIHAAARSRSTGRVRTGSTGQNMAVTRAAIRNELMKLKIRQVGILNAGWLRAAKRLKTTKRATPAWITRHGDMPGGVSIRASKHGLSISVSNKMKYLPKNMEGRIKSAINRRTHGIEQALEKMLKDKAEKANQRMKQ